MHRYDIVTNYIKVVDWTYHYVCMLKPFMGQLYIQSKKYLNVLGVFMSNDSLRSLVYFCEKNTLLSQYDPNDANENNVLNYMMKKGIIIL